MSKSSHITIPDTFCAGSHCGQVRDRYGNHLHEPGAACIQGLCFPCPRCSNERLNQAVNEGIEAIEKRQASAAKYLTECPACKSADLGVSRKDVLVNYHCFSCNWHFETVICPKCGDNKLSKYMTNDYTEYYCLSCTSHFKFLNLNLNDLSTKNNETRITDPDTGGQKGTKPARFDLVPWEQIWKVAELYGKGAEKYDEHNWRLGYAWSLSFAAMLRHAVQFWNGESIDPELGTHHLTSVIFHALALMEFEQTHPEKDDRYVSKKEETSHK